MSIFQQIPLPPKVVDEIQSLSKTQVYDLVLLLVKKLPDSFRRELAVDITAMNNPGDLSQLHIVRAVVEIFKDRLFTLDDVCSQIQEVYPNCHLGRRIVARRLYDLQRARPPVIQRVPWEAMQASEEAKKRYQYRYLGPPV